MRIYRRLQDEQDFKGSYSSVRRYICQKKMALKTHTSGYLPLLHPLGSGQVDFGESMGYDAKGQEMKFFGLTISFPNSNKGYTQAVPSQNQECLLEGMKQIFEQMGGVPPILRFDNMSTAVAHVGKNGERTLTDGFRRFMLHYRFEAVFCNPASGNEKGNVENKVGYSRRNAFVPVPTIVSFGETNKELWKWCEQDAERLHYKHNVPIAELWKEDEKHLLTLPTNPYIVFRYATVTVDKVGFATIDTNKYGLSPQFAGQTVQAKIFFDHIAFFYDHKPIANFQRSYGKNEEIFDWTQYVTTLCRKPGAIEHTRFFQQMPEPLQSYLSHSQGKERKNALQLLQEIVENGDQSLWEDALALASSNGRSDIDSIRQCYYMIAKKEYHPHPLKLSDVPTLNVQPNLSAYDGLTGGGANG